MIEFKPYREKYKDEIIALLSAGKSPEYHGRKEKIWDWQYNANPFSNNAPKGAVLLCDGKLAGFNGFMHVRVKHHDEWLQAFWGVDTIVDPGFRGKGLGQKLCAHVYGAHPLVISFGTSDIQSHIRKKQGARVNRAVQEYFFWNKAKTLKNLVKKGIQHTRRIQALGRRPSTKNLEPVVTPDLPDHLVVEALWEKMKTGYPKLAVRSHAYLKWKYQDYPLSCYHYIIIEKQNEIIGMGIFRKDPTHARLLDYLGPAKNVQLKYALVETFKNQCADSDLLSCITTDEELKQCLDMAGFRKYGVRPRFYIHSALPHDPDPEKDWLLMTGDSDGDISL